MSGWRVLVTLHNLVNIPPNACEGNRTFTVEAQVRGAVSVSYKAPSPSASFSVNDVTESTPQLFEVRLDDAARATNNAKVWHCSAPRVEVLVLVKERSASYRLVGASVPFSVDVKDVVEGRKLHTRVIGTEMGQVGLSFSVDPADKDGYRRRLHAFLQRYNPQGLRLVDSVVAAVPEVDTFTKLYRKYNLQDYDGRLRRFFATYGPDFIAQVPTLVTQWENREEELIRNLVLDNGPELADIDADARLDAFLSAHQLPKSSGDVNRLLRTYNLKTQTSKLFEALVQRFGPEPDPRTYAFMPSHYTPNQSIAEKKAPSSPTPRSRTRDQSSIVDSPEVPPYRPGATQEKEHLLSLSLSPNGEQETAERQYTQRVPDSSAAQPSALSSSYAAQKGFFQDALFSDARKATTAPSTAKTPSVDPSPSAALVPAAHDGRPLSGAPSATMEGLWRRLVSAVQAEGLQPQDVFYGDKDTFADLIDCMDAFSRSDRSALIREWRRRLEEAVREEPIGKGSPLFDSVLFEAAPLVKVEPLCLQVVGATAVYNKEHVSAFAAATAGMRQQRVERLALVGDDAVLRRVVREGAGTWTTGLTPSHPSGVVFLREPFRHWKESRTTSMLLCDVALGRSCACPAGTRVPDAPSKEQAREFDSFTFVDGSSGPAVMVFRPQQIIPRFLLQCTIDPTVRPCPSHPGRAVEYYVVDADKFVCSRCAVLGEYKGHDIVSIEEAAVAARHRLVEVQRAADAVRESMAALEKQLETEEGMMANAPRHINAVRDIDRIQRETEEKINRIKAAIEQADRDQLTRIRNERTELEVTRTNAQRLSDQIAASLHSTTPIQVVGTLQQVQQQRELDHILTWATERLPDASLEKILPLCAPDQDKAAPSPPPPVRATGLNESRFAPSDTAASRFMGPSIYGTRSNLFADESTYTSDIAGRRDKSVHQRYLPVSGSSAPPNRPSSGTQPSHSTRESSVTSSSAASSVRGVRKVNRAAPIPSSSASSMPDEQREEREQLAEQHQHQHQQQQQQQQQQLQHEEDFLPEAALTKGWALLHQGDSTGAKAEWQRVAAACGEGTDAGAKARAYLAEAIEKNYAKAAQWYDACLSMNPNDRMTAYNYGVLLEAVLGREEEALALYNKAASLGDTVAAARAKQLQSAMENE